MTLYLRSNIEVIYIRHTLFVNRAVVRAYTEHRIATVGVGFPVTPFLACRIRFCLSAAHTKEQLKYVSINIKNHSIIMLLNSLHIENKLVIFFLVTRCNRKDS